MSIKKSNDRLIDMDVEFLYYLLTFRNDEFLMMG